MLAAITLGHGGVAMTNSELSLVAAIFGQALDKTPEERRAFVEAQTQDAKVQAQVFAMLEAHDQTGGFIETAGGLGDITSLENGTIVGSWKITERLGAGGMGEVYEAKRSDGHFDQSAALKLIGSSDPSLWKRFATERQVLADLEHPSISRLIDGGVAQDGKPFLVMEKIEGLDLKTAAEEHDYDQDQILRLFVELCEAVSFAHGRLILHRDIKPSNILVTAESRVKLVDFGIAGLLATPVDAEASLYTKAYAAPEQIAGNTAQVQSDIFALGMTLHELLTGLLPARLEDGSNGVDPAKVQLTGELAAIFDKATKTSAGERYASAQALADDIEAIVTHHPVSAVPQSRGYLWGKFYRRNRASVTLAASLVAALVIGFGAVSWFAYETNRAYKAEAASLADAEERALFADTSSRLFAEISGQAIAAQDQGAVDMISLLEEARANAASAIGEKDESARIRLYALSTLHERRSDVKAILASLKPIYDAPDTLDRATVMGLRTYGYYAGFSGDADLANKAFDRVEALIEQDPVRFGFERVELMSIRSENSPDTEVVGEAVKEMVGYAQGVRAGSTNDRNDAVYLFNRAAQLSTRAGDPEAALGHLTNALEISKSISGAKAIPEAFLMFGLVAVNGALGRTGEALAINTDTIEEARRLFGPSVGLGQRLQTHGDLLLELERGEEAVDYYEQAASLFERFDAPGGDSVISAKMDALVAKASSGNVDQALRSSADLLAKERVRLAANPLASFHAHLRQGRLFEMAEQSQGALASYRKALDAASAAGTRPDYIAQAKAAVERLSE